MVTVPRPPTPEEGLHDEMEISTRTDGRLNEIAECTIVAPGATMPARAGSGAVGYDLFAIEDVVLKTK